MHSTLPYTNYFLINSYLYKSHKFKKDAINFQLQTYIYLPFGVLVIILPQAGILNGD